MKAYEKRKIWRRNVAAKQKQGLINVGLNWVQGNSSTHGSMATHMVNGSNHRKIA